MDAADIEGCLNAPGRCQSRVLTELFILRAVLQPEVAIQETETICGPQGDLAGSVVWNENVPASKDARTGDQTRAE